MASHNDQRTVYECRHCSGPVAADAPACPRCGSQTPFPQKEIRPKEEVTVSRVLWVIFAGLMLAAMVAYALCPGCRGVGVMF